MMRITREEESYIGRAPHEHDGRARVGFAKDGRITALDLFIVQDTAPTDRWATIARPACRVADLSAAAPCAGARSTC
jgi:CO/xanthine dehydrogenase Mo-binding subunit